MRGSTTYFYLLLSVFSRTLSTAGVAPCCEEKRKLMLNLACAD